MPLQEQWRIPNDERYSPLAYALLKVCEPTKTSRIVRIQAMKHQIAVFNTWPQVRQVSEAVQTAPRLRPADEFEQDIYQGLQGSQSAIIIREGDDAVVLAAHLRMDAYNGIYDYAVKLRDQIRGFTLTLEPIMAPLETLVA